MPNRFRAPAAMLAVYFLSPAIPPAQPAQTNGTPEAIPFQVAPIEIAKLPAKAPKQSETQVALEVRFLTVSGPSFVERIVVDVRFAGDSPQDSKGKPERAEAATVKSPPDATTSPLSPAFLSEQQVRQALEYAQGDRNMNLVQAPRMLLSNGQVGEVDLTDTQYFLTSVEPVGSGADVILRPKNEPFKLGLRIKAQPLVASDRQSVQVALKINRTSLTSTTVPLIPITIPLGADKNGKSVQRIFLQQPAFSTLAIDQTTIIPLGKTAVFGSFQRLSESRNESTPPAASKIPYISRFLTNVSYGREMLKEYILVTPRVIVNGEELKDPPSHLTPVRVHGGVGP